MNTHENDGITTGFNDLKQLEMSVEAAQNMVGAATMSMDSDQLQAATDSIRQAKNALQNVQQNPTGVDGEVINQSQHKINAIEEQLKEANQK